MRDAPHANKCARNLLASKKGIHIPQCAGLATWDHIEQLYEHDAKSSFKIVSKLTDRHVYNLKFDNKMKFKLTCNVLSHSTSAGLNTMVSANQISPSALATCIYCQKLINSPSFKASVHLRRPIMMKSEKTLNFVNESIPWFKRLEKINDRQCKFIGGMIQNLNVVMKLVVNLSSMGIPFLCTRNLNQDPLEHFFSTIQTEARDCG